MDALEIMTVIRNIPGLEREEDISTKVLLRAVNLGYRELCKAIAPKVMPYLTQLDFSKTVTSGNFSYPPDLMVPINVYRNAVRCSRINLSEKSLLGSNVNYPEDAANPLYIDLGRSAYIYPALSSTTCKVDYVRFPADLLFGDGNISDGDIVLFDGKKINDLYNNTEIVIYQRIEATISYIEKGTIADYTGATKTAATDLTDNNGIIYATVPVIPEYYHRYIPDAAIIELAKLKKVDPDTAKLSAEIFNTQLKQEAA